MQRLIPLLVSLTLLLSGLIPSVHLSQAAGGMRSLALSRADTSPYTPDRIREAYDIAPLYANGIEGRGQTIALLALDRYTPADLTVFDSTYGLPGPSIGVRYAGGKPFPLQVGAETALNVEWLHALAPDARIAIYYVDASAGMMRTWRSMSTALNDIGRTNAAIVSISMGGCGLSRGSGLVHAALQTLFLKGVSVFASSGDDGDHPGPVTACGRSIGVTYPGSDPFVVSVGGTSLQLRPNNTVMREIAWRGSGGGRVAALLRRNWEQARSLPKDGARWAPDVAYVGDPHTGVTFFHAGHWHTAGGTSVGAPSWAAIWALVRQKASATGKSPVPAGQLLYRIGNSAKYTLAFHDITVGSNGAYHAGSGWDPVTGWGTPRAGALADVVSALTSAG